MRIDDLLRTSAADVAATVAPPGVDPAQVRARVRARRAATRRRLLGAVLLAAVVATALLVVLGQGRRPAASPPPRPEAPRDAAVWADARGIHVGARTFRPAARPVSLTLVADGLVYTDRDGRVWLQGLAGSSPYPIGRVRLGTAPLGAADGTTVAWIASTSGRDYLVMYDARKRAELARSLVVGGLGDGTLTGGTHVDSPGPFFYVDPERVIYHASLGTFAFDRGTGRFTRLAGEQPRPDAETLPGDLLVTVDAVPGLRAVAICCAEDPLLQRPAAFVDDAGKVLTRIGRLEASGLFDHDWRRYAAVVDTSRHGQRVEVVDVDSGRARAITRRTTFFSLLGWGYGDVLMVYEFDVDAAGASGPPRLLRCDVSAWSCAPVDLPPGRVVLPTS